MGERFRVYVNIGLPAALLEPLRETCDLAVYPGRGRAPRDELLSEVASADGLLGFALVDRELLDRAPRLRVVSNVAVGYDNVDLPLATERGVLVTNTPGVLTDAVADLTMALMLQLSRRLNEVQQFVRSGDWGRGGSLPPLGVDLRGKTLAVVGLGRIGLAVTRRARAFGMNVVYYDIRADLPDAGGATRRRTLEEALREADFVSIHTNLTDSSRHLIGAPELAAMRPSSFLINTSRGAMIDQRALYEALRLGGIAGAALDVLEAEPPASDEPLLSLPNVVITPHIGSATAETRAAMVELAVRNLRACLTGDHCECVLNPEARGHP